MAEKGKKSAGDKPATAKKTEDEKPSSKAADHADEAKPLAKAADAHDAHGHDAHAHDGHGHAAAAAHGHAPNRAEYFKVFAALFALTVLEVIVANPKLGISRTLVGIALVGMAVTKAAMVGFFYMHLKHETKILKYTVAIPMVTPAFYALVLVSEAAWRLTR
jgi:cytochrome c oxidase subunit 4